MGTTHAHRIVRLLPLLAILAMLVGMSAATPAQAASGSVSPQEGGVGTRFHFNAMGFFPGERVDSWVTGPSGGSQPRYPSVYADVNGQIVWSWDVAPGTPNGRWNMTARGIDSDIRVVIGFTVTGVPTLNQGSVSPSSGPVGTRFSFRASGFNSGERIGAWLTQPSGQGRDFEPGEEFRAYADTNGAVSWDWTVPDGVSPGGWIASARGLDTRHQVNISFSITGAAPTGPIRSVTPAAGLPGTTFTVVVGGFNATEVAGSWLTRPDGNSIAAVPYLKADDKGVVTWTWHAPGDAPSGLWQAVTKGTDSQLQVTLPFTVGGANPAPGAPAGPTVSLSPASVQPGATLTVSASGFAPHEELNYWPTRPDGLPVENRTITYADAQGNGAWTYQVPNNAVAGSWIFNVHGKDSDRNARAPFTVVMADPAAGTGVSPASGRPGTTFTFTASGFRDDPEYVYFWFNDPDGQGVNGPERKRNKDDGTVTWEWTAPADAAAGQWQAIARGERSSLTRIIPFTIIRDAPPAPAASASVAPESGARGTTFTFTADGFSENERVGYWLNLPDGTVVRFDRELTADSKGRITWTWAAPADAQRGLYVMAAKTSQNENNKDINHVISYEIRFTVQ